MNNPKPCILVPQGRPLHGFTLIELLICITIVIVLAAIVFVMTGKIRTNAQQANAVSAMRQIGIANVAYYSENNGAINVIRDKSEWGQYEGSGTAYTSNSFMGRMQPYLFSGFDDKNEKQLNTAFTASFSELLGTRYLKTMAGTLCSGVPVTSDGSGIPNPIAINDKLRPTWGKTNPPRRVSSFGDPAGIVYLTYGRYYFNQVIASKYLPLPQTGDNRRAIYFLPNRKGVFCFLDGHVEMLSTPIPERSFD